MTKSVWQYQKDLMTRSDQYVPDRAEITPGSFLYFALNLEELSELAEALNDSLSIPTAVYPQQRVKEILTECQELLHERSLEIRQLLKQNTDNWPTIMPSRENFKKIMDANIDLMVTNSGFSLSTGSPGEQAYAITAESNLSKTNPETGKIDKTPDGKWIKGSAYQEPNFEKLLDDALPIKTQDAEPFYKFLYIDRVDDNQLQSDFEVKKDNLFVFKITSGKFAGLTVKIGDFQFLDEDLPDGSNMTMELVYDENDPRVVNDRDAFVETCQTLALDFITQAINGLIEKKGLEHEFD